MINKIALSKKKKMTKVDDKKDNIDKISENDDKPL